MKTTSNKYIAPELKFSSLINRRIFCASSQFGEKALGVSGQYDTVGDGLDF